MAPRRDVAQSGSALEWGSRGRRFKSFHPDQKFRGVTDDSVTPFSVSLAFCAISVPDFSMKASERY